MYINFRYIIVGLTIIADNNLFLMYLAQSSLILIKRKRLCVFLLPRVLEQV